MFEFTISQSRAIDITKSSSDIPKSHLWRPKILDNTLLIAEKYTPYGPNKGAFSVQF